MTPSSVLRIWLRRWLGLDAKPEPLEGREAEVESRLSRLEENVDFLAGALRRLRGRVVGGLRADPARDGEDGVPVSDAPPVRYSNAWMTEEEHRRLAHARDQGRATIEKGERP